MRKDRRLTALGLPTLAADKFYIPPTEEEKLIARIEEQMIAGADPPMFWDGTITSLNGVVFYGSRSQAKMYQFGQLYGRGLRGHGKTQALQQLAQQSYRQMYAYNTRELSGPKAHLLGTYAAWDAELTSSFYATFEKIRAELQLAARPPRPRQRRPGPTYVPVHRQPPVLRPASCRR